MPRMIDEDKILKWISNHNYVSSDLIGNIVPLQSLKIKIQSLAIEFDDDGWCWDMDKIPIQKLGQKIAWLDVIIKERSGKLRVANDVIYYDNVFYNDMQMPESVCNDNTIVAFRLVASPYPPIPQKKEEQENE